MRGDVWNVLGTVKAVKYFCEFDSIAVFRRIHVNVEISCNDYLAFVQGDLFESSRQISEESIRDSC